MLNEDKTNKILITSDGMDTLKKLFRPWAYDNERSEAPRVLSLQEKIALLNKLNMMSGEE